MPQAVMIGAMVVAAAVSTYSAISTANTASATASYNAKVAANNQIIADQAAVTAKQEGDITQQQKAYQEDVLVGQQKAGLAANGVDVGSGSALDLVGDTKKAGEFDQLTIQNNAARTAAGFTNQGISYQNQAGVDQAASSAALQGGELKAASSVVSGAGQVAGQWYKFSQSDTSGAGNFAGNGSIY